MAKYAVTICDFCKRSESECDQPNTIYHHKVKRANHPRIGGWVNLDICTECLDELRNKIRNKED